MKRRSELSSQNIQDYGEEAGCIDGAASYARCSVVTARTSLFESLLWMGLKLKGPRTNTENIGNHIAGP
jgi:hypothetical protein